MGTVALALASSAAASLLLPFHEPPRPPQLEHASRQPLSRRSLFGLGTAAAAVAAFPGSVQAAGNPLPLPPAAVVLQVADNTIAMQGMMIQSVKDMDELTDQQRKDVGRWPPIAREELRQSVDVLLRNSRLASYPKGDDAAGVFYGIKFILGSGDSPLTRDEYILVASQYGKGRDACRAVFESFTQAEQSEAKNIVNQIRAKDEARVREYEEEEAKVLAAKKKLADAESRAPASSDAPPRKKTLKELEEANARAFSAPPPTASLYGVGTATR